MVQKRYRKTWLRNISSQNHGRRRCRTGSATVELTVAIPLLIGIVFGGIEASNALYMQQTVTEASYQGALVGMQTWSDEATVELSVQQMLEARGVILAEIEIVGTDGTPFDNLEPGQAFKVSVDVPADENSLSGALSGKYQSFASTSHTFRQ